MLSRIVIKSFLALMFIAPLNPGVFASEFNYEINSRTLKINGNTEDNNLHITKNVDVFVFSNKDLETNQLNHLFDVPASDFDDLFINLYAGDDYVEINDINVPGFLRLWTWNGADRISLKNVIVDGTLEMKTGSGSDLVDLFSVQSNILETDLGSDDDHFEWKWTTFTESAEILGGDGDNDRILTQVGCSDMSHNLVSIGFETGVVSAGYVEAIDWSKPVVKFRDESGVDQSLLINEDKSVNLDVLVTLSSSSDQLQTEINTLSGNGGGIIEILEGVYKLAMIKMASNVHLRVDKNAHLLLDPNERPPLQTSPMFIFSDGIHDTSIRGRNGRYSVYLNTGRASASFASAEHVTNFLVSSVNIYDNYTKYSAIGTSVVWDGSSQSFKVDEFGRDAMPTGGTFKDISHFNAHVGYGLVQTSAGRNLHFENLYGKGGVTLRLETHWLKMNGFGVGGVFDIRGWNIVSEDGFKAVVFTPHTAKNGRVEIRDVSAYGSYAPVAVNSGWISPHHYEEDENGNLLRKYGDFPLSEGWFESGSSVDNVHAVYGESAQCQLYRDMKYYPEELKSKIVEIPHPFDPSIPALEPLSKAPSLFYITKDLDLNYDVQMNGLMTLQELHENGFSHLANVIEVQ